MQTSLNLRTIGQKNIPPQTEQTDEIFNNIGVRKNYKSQMVKRPINDLSRSAESYTNRSKNSNDNSSLQLRRQAMQNDQLKVRQTEAREYALSISMLDQQFNDFDHKKAREQA